MSPKVLAPLVQFLDEHGLPNQPEVLARFEGYLGLIERARRRMNLVGTLSPSAIVRELFCDSLTIAALGWPLHGPILDVGTGAGFPGVALKLLDPALTLWLVEPREKRQQFLGMVIRRLGLEAVTRHRARIEDLALPPEAGLVCSKAVVPVDAWLPMAAALVRPRGRVAVLCADAHWTEDREAQARTLGLAREATKTFMWRDGAPRRRTLLLKASPRAASPDSHDGAPQGST